MFSDGRFHNDFCPLYPHVFNGNKAINILGKATFSSCWLFHHLVGQ